MAFFHKANDDEKSKIFGDKVLFLEAFNKFVKRDWIDINKATFDDYCNFVNKHEKFIKKPTDLSCGRGISLDKKRDDIKNQYLDLKNEHFLLEELIVQNDEMSKLHTSSVNSIRVATVNFNGKVEILGATLRVGSGGGCIDNYCAGGYACAIDVETGKVISLGLNEKQIREIKHPDSHIVFPGFQIPYWDKVIEIVNEAAMVVPEVRYTGWDVAILKDDVCLIEGNNQGMFNVLQAPLNRGIKEKIKDLMNKF